MNLNTLFDKLTNFKIGFYKGPSPADVSNKKLVFIVKRWEREGDRLLYYKNIEDIRLNSDKDRVEIIIN